MIFAESALTAESAVTPVLMMGSVVWQTKCFLAKRKLNRDSASVSSLFCLSSPESMCWWSLVVVFSLFFRLFSSLNAAYYLEKKKKNSSGSHDTETRIRSLLTHEVQVIS